MDNFVNLGHFYEGHIPEGWRTSLLSPFGKIISETEWKRDGWNDADLDFKQQTLDTQKIIMQDFETFFNGFGNCFVVFCMIEPDHTVDNQIYFEPLFEPIFRRENLTCFIDDFLHEKSLPFVFHLERECFVRFTCDMGVSIFHKANLPKIEGLEIVKLIEV